MQPQAFRDSGDDLEDAGACDELAGQRKERPHLEE
jgi:hypothetical protein